MTFLISAIGHRPLLLLHEYALPWGRKLSPWSLRQTKVGLEWSGKDSHVSGIVSAPQDTVIIYVVAKQLLKKSGHKLEADI